MNQQQHDLLQEAHDIMIHEGMLIGDTVDGRYRETLTPYGHEVLDSYGHHNDDMATLAPAMLRLAETCR